jgi:flagella basal body P-ring formation protein FlgA
MIFGTDITKLLQTSLGTSLALLALTLSNALPALAGAPSESPTPNAAATNTLESIEDTNTTPTLDSDLPVAPQVPLAATLSFLPSIDIDTERLFLGKVAVCSGTAQICDEAYAIDLGPSPEPGRTTVWHPERARAVLAKEWPGADIRLTGAKAVKITANAVPLSEERVATALKSILSEAYGEGDDFTVRLDRLTLAIGFKLRPGEFKIEFPELTPEHLQSSDWVLRNLSGTQRLSFNCRPSDSDESAASFSVSAHFTVLADLPVTSHPLSKGRDLSSDDLMTAAVPITRSGFNYAKNDADLLNHRLRRPLAAGVPILASDVELPRLVKRGQMVTLQVSGGEVAVTGQVKVLSDGMVGQVIEAQYPATKKKLRVRVIDSNKVEYVL